MTSELLALADRVEAAKGPDRELDCLIWATVTGEKVVWTGPDNHLLIIGGAAIGWIDPGAHSRNFGCNRDTTGPGSIPAYTASLDAAWINVPETTDVVLGRDWCIRRYARITDGTTTWHGEGVTEPLALTAAALRSHASRVGDGRGK